MKKLILIFFFLNLWFSKEIYEAIDPARKNIHPQTYLFVSELDDVVPVSQGSLGGAETIFVEGAGHSDYGHPGTLAFSRLKELLLNEK